MSTRPDPLFDMTHRGHVPPVPQGTCRPLWSVMIPVYNGAGDLARSLGSVLAQDPGPDVMQIEVVDDVSTRDDPEAVVRSMAGDRVAFVRQPANVGHARNFNTCVARSRGRLVHILHADDWVAPGFYTAMGALLDAEPLANAAFCRHAVIGPHGTTQRVSPLERPEPGIIADWLPRIAAGLCLQPPAMVVRREAYEALGAFDMRMPSCGEDWEMWVRLAVRAPTAFHPEVLAFYQDSAGSLTKRAVRSGQNIRDVRQATAITRTYLPAGAPRRANDLARRSWAHWGLYWAWQLIEGRDYAAARISLREALLCSHAPEILRQAAKLTLYGMRKAARERWRHSDA